jgi:hypothetical protein
VFVTEMFLDGHSKNCPFVSGSYCLISCGALVAGQNPTEELKLWLSPLADFRCFLDYLLHDRCTVVATDCVELLVWKFAAFCDGTLKRGSSDVICPCDWRKSSLKSQFLKHKFRVTLTKFIARRHKFQYWPFSEIAQEIRVPKQWNLLVMQKDHCARCETVPLNFAQMNRSAKSFD